MKKLNLLLVICALLLISVPVHAQVSDYTGTYAPGNAGAANTQPQWCPPPSFSTSTGAAAAVAPAPAGTQYCPPTAVSSAPQRAMAPQTGTEMRLGPYIGIGGSYAIQNFNKDLGLTGAGGNKDWDNAWGVNGRLGYQMSRITALEVEYNFLKDFENKGNNDAKLDAQTLMAVAKFYAPTPVPFKPFLAGGIGWMHTSTEGPAITKDLDSKNAWGAKVGLGVDYYPVSEISIGAEADYVFGVGDLTDIRYTNLSLGVAYHF